MLFLPTHSRTAHLPNALSCPHEAPSPPWQTHDEMTRLPLLSFAVLHVLSSPATASAAESTSTLSFGEGFYTYHQDIEGLPLCPDLLETLYSLDTMRALTSFVDTITVLEEERNSQTLRVTYSVIGIHGALVYERQVDRPSSTMVIRLLSSESNVDLVPYPSSFVAGYGVTHDESQTRVVYTQDANLPSRIAMVHQLFVKSQMRRFERRLLRIAEESCP